MADTMEAMGALFSQVAHPVAEAPLNPEEGTPEEVEVPAPADATDEVAQADDGEEVAVEEVEGEPDTSLKEDGPLWKGIVDGQEREITDHTELNQAVSYGLNYGEKVRALSEDRRTFEAERDQFTAEIVPVRQQMLQELHTIKEVLGNPDVTRPQRQNYQTPEAFDQALAAWDEQRGAVNAVNERIAEQQEALAKDQRAQFERFLADSEAETLTRIPEWVDQTVRTAEAGKIEAYLASQGATPELMGRNPLVSYEPVFRVIARKAWLYDQAQEKGKETVKEAKTKAAAPGPSAETASAQTGKRLRETKKGIKERGGKVDDVAPLMGAIMDRTIDLQRK